MNTTTTLLVAMLSACAILPLRAQWGTDVQNNNINFEFGIQDNAFSGDNDFDNQSDPTIRTDVAFGGSWMGEYCYAWDCTAPCYSSSNGGWWAGSNYGYSTTFSTFILGYESDNSDECSWYSDDDQAWQGQSTLRDGASSCPIVYPSSDFAPCHWNPYLGNGGAGWLYPNSPHFNQIMRLTWRYAAGDGPNNMLDFGTVAMNTTKADVNSNQAVATSSGYPLQYSNLYGDAAADVFYKFHLDQASTVIVSTDHPLTNFDTKIHLFYLNGGTLIASDDDGGTMGSTSTITVQLCAGDYEVIAEGYNSNTGLFRLSVTAQAPIAPSVAVISNSGASCPGAIDGVVSWSSTGGAGPVGYLVNGTNVGANTTISDFGVGTHTVQVVDACGSIGSVTFDVINADATPPTAICLTALEVDVADGDPATLVGLGANGIDNGSSDNCGIVSYTTSPSELTTADVGFNTVTLTVADANGNASTCTCQVYAVNVTGIAESEASARIRLMPNPSDGHFRMDLSELALSAKTQLTILDPLGRAVFTTNPTRSILDMDLGHLPNGTYMLRLNDPQWDASTRIVVQR